MNRESDSKRRLLEAMMAGRTPLLSTGAHEMQYARPGQPVASMLNPGEAIPPELQKQLLGLPEDALQALFYQRIFWPQVTKAPPDPWAAQVQPETPWAPTVKREY